MEQHVRVELVPRMVPIDDATRAQRTDTVERMANLGQIDPASGRIGEVMQDGWLARINGVEVPVLAYGLEQPEAGTRAVVSLVLSADSVQVGDPSLGASAPTVRLAAPEQKKPGTWGQPGPDPREGIAGWKSAAATHG